MTLDDLVDDRTNRASPGERFREEWLVELPKSQWPAYIDESAQLVADGIFIGDTDLTSADFGVETGIYYQRGLANTADIDHRNTSLPLGNYSPKAIGKVAWTFNQLHEELRTAHHTDFENPSRAIEAAINKALVERIDTNGVTSDDIETIRLPETASVSTIISEVFCRPRSEVYIDLLFETIEDSSADGLLNRIEEPRMVTRLWSHQRDALDKWLANDCRGYADMATATGKTFLGLAAIAHHFGTLHPTDRDLTSTREQPDQTDRATVVIVAHRELILDQWKREFDTHLNIPEQSSTNRGEHTAHFEWGDVHFWTPGRLQNADILEEDIDLVVLDETHHYLGSTGFGSLLDHLDGDVLALSGSLDETNARTLERRNIPKLFEFSLRDGQRAGVVPQCDWDVVLTPYENQAQLAEVTERCRRGLSRYADGIDVPGDLEADTDVLTIENLSDARSVTQSSVGRELKEIDEDFREFASALMARQLTQYNLSPELSTVLNLILDNLDQHKCVVLLETKAEIKTVTDELKRHLGYAYESLITVLDDDIDLRSVEEFDQHQESGAIIGIAQTLGEGIDIQTADVCINRGRGRLSRSLVQRMGRILRNPTGDKEAQFYHIAAIPTRDEALLPDEDGVRLLETASKLLDWGEGFDARPVFTLDEETTLTAGSLADLENAGAEAIEKWEPDQYDPPSDEGIHDTLEMLLKQIKETDSSALLNIERVESASIVGSDNEAGEEPAKSELDDGIQFIAADGGGIELADWLYELAAAASDDTNTFVEDAVRTYAQETIAYPAADAVPDSQKTCTVELNPALDALLSTYVGDGSKNTAIHAAVGEMLPDGIDTLRNKTELTMSTEEITQKLDEFSRKSDA